VIISNKVATTFLQPTRREMITLVHFGKCVDVTVSLPQKWNLHWNWNLP